MTEAEAGAATKAEPGPTTEQTRAVTILWPYFSGGVAIALVVLLGVILLLRQNTPFEFDGEWMDDITNSRDPFLTTVSAVMAWLGGGWFAAFAVPVVVVGLLCLVRRFWAAAYFGVATLVCAALTRLLKNIFGRARPEEILIPADFGSFPSGHTSNAATIAVVLASCFALVGLDGGRTLGRAHGAQPHLPRRALGERHDRRHDARRRGRTPASGRRSQPSCIQERKQSMPVAA